MKKYEIEHIREALDIIHRASNFTEESDIAAICCMILDQYSYKNPGTDPVKMAQRIAQSVEIINGKISLADLIAKVAAEA